MASRLGPGHSLVGKIGDKGYHKTVGKQRDKKIRCCLVPKGRSAQGLLEREAPGGCSVGSIGTPLSLEKEKIDEREGHQHDERQELKPGAPTHTVDDNLQHTRAEDRREGYS